MNSQTDETALGARDSLGHIPALARPRAPVVSQGGFTAGKVVGLVGIFLFACYPEVVLCGHSFFYRDFGFFGYPLAHYWRESFWLGEVPLWNPLSNCGLPFLAQWNTIVTYPLSIVYLLLPLPWSLNFFCLGHLLLAAAGMYWLAHRWTGDRFAASVAGLAYALNGLTLHALMWPNNIAALAWMPVVVLTVERAWRDGRRHIILATLAGATQMLAGAPEIILLTWLVLAALWLGQVLRHAIALRLALPRLMAVAALVFGLAASQLLPFLDLLAHAQDNRTVSKEYWAMPAWGWANLLVPLFHCSPSILGGVFSQTDQQWTSSYYLGIGMLALALLSAWRVRNARVAFLAVVALAGLILALGENGYVLGWLKHAVPAIAFLRYPMKFVVLTVFALPLLAAFGLDWLQRGPPNDEARRQRSLFLVGVPLLLLIAGVLTWARWSPLSDDSWRATWQSAVTSAGLLTLIVAALVCFVRVQSTRRRGWAGLVVLALVGLDALTHTPRQNPTVPNRAYGMLDLSMSPRPRPGESRAMISHPMQLFLGNAAMPKAVDYYRSTRRALYANCNLLEDIPKVNGFYSLYLKEEAEVRALLYNPTNALPGPLADFLGVSQISAPTVMFAWQTRPGFMTFVSAGQRPVFLEAPETLQALASPDFDPRNIVYLPTEARQFITASNSATAKATLRGFTSRKLDLAVESAEPTIVVVAQAYYHAWKVYVDGKSVRLWRANHAFQALEVPAGRHEVKLVYEDRMFLLGASLSSLALLACLVAWVFWSQRTSGASPRPQ